MISVADNSPELQLAVDPSWTDDPSSGHLQPTHYQDFANYAADVGARVGFCAPWDGVLFSKA